MKIIDKRDKLLKHNKKKYRRRLLKSIKVIAIHHSLTLQGSSEAFARYHVRKNNWSGIGYTYVVNQNGTIDFTNDWEAVSAHVGSSNKRALGICLVGDFRTTEPTAEQLQATADLCQMLINKIPSIEQIKGHSEFPSYSWKPCPAFDVMRVTNRMKTIKNKISI